MLLRRVGTAVCLDIPFHEHRRFQEGFYLIMFKLTLITFHAG